MSELAISSKEWLAISSRNGMATLFNLNNQDQWQCLKVVDNNNSAPTESSTSQKSTEEEDDLNRNLIKFTPDGNRFVVNGQNKQIHVYQWSDGRWFLSKTINVKKRASTLDVTNEFLLIGDKSGDVYKFDFIDDEQQTTVTLNEENCLMGHLSMLLDLVFFRLDDKTNFVLTSDRDEKIRLSRFPNAYSIEGFCLGHTEFVSHLKILNENKILSASGDGTLRFWSLPNCELLKIFHSKEFLKDRKRFFESKSSEKIEENVELSTVDSSIWKVDVCSTKSIYVALSIFSSRSKSIFLVEFDQNEFLLRSTFEIFFDENRSSIIDYSFSSSNLFVVFDDGNLIKIDVETTLRKEKIVFSDELFKKINEILRQDEFRPINRCQTHLNIFQQLFKTRLPPGDSSYYKRKNERLLQAEEKQKKSKN